MHQQLWGYKAERENISGGTWKKKVEYHWYIIYMIGGHVPAKLTVLLDSVVNWSTCPSKFTYLPNVKMPYILYCLWETIKWQNTQRSLCKTKERQNVQIRSVTGSISGHFFVQQGPLVSTGRGEAPPIQFPIHESSSDVSHWSVSQLPTSLTHWYVLTAALTN